MMPMAIVYWKLVNGEWGEGLRHEIRYVDFEISN